MRRFVIDEDLPRSTSTFIEKRGWEALDVRDCGLRGKSDDKVFQFAQVESAILLSGDLGFGNLLKFPIGSHSGIVILHFPNEVLIESLHYHLGFALDQLREEDFAGNLVIIEPGKMRIRRRSP